MCGISGYLGKEKISKNLINKTLLSMRNRGPDHQGYDHIGFGENNLYLLSSRLKIVDRNVRSNQPMNMDDLTIVYNGEIYNIAELKKKIFSYGLKLKTESDTEIILKMYKIFGTKCVDHFEGMWAFLIYDHLNQLVFISRDRIGEKPLYYLKNKDGFFFGSETKFIRILLNNYKEINAKKITHYLKYGYKSIERSNESFFKNIFKMEAGTNFIIKKNLHILKSSYWKPKVNEQKFSENTCKKLIRENFEKKIKLICNTDLNIGLSLSGGIDSNFILSFIKKKLNKSINTYSIIDQNSNKYNEEDLINFITKKYGIRNKKIYLSNQKDYLPDLKKLIRYHDKPISTISYFLQSLIYKEMKKDNIKISITGNGADELFTGYYHHYNLFYQILKTKSDKKKFFYEWNKNINPLIRNKEYKNIFKKKIKTYFTLLDNKYFKNSNLNNYSEKKIVNNVLRNKMLNELLFQTVPLALIDDDLNAMCYSIENRSPFLNKELVELSLSFPSNLFMKNAYSKYLLRIGSQNILDDKIRLNREKKGFNASFSSIFSQKNKKFYEWFYDSDKKNPIYSFLDRKVFLETFYTKHDKIFPDMATQTIFNICSAKIFLEEINK
jgi:asparagine synthase (glutamine-hydrolysing)